MRVFLGVKVPDHLRRELTARLDGLPARPRLRWVDPSCWHLTLQFLGQWPPERCKALEDRLLALGRHPAFDLEMGPVGQFPARGPLRVLYLQVDGGTKLLALTRSIRAEVDAAWPAGPQDRKPFRPHLTLARGARPAVAVDLPRIGEDPPLPSWRMDGFSLFSSDLTPGGPIYREETFFALRK